jgi:O-antigen/teichoic acid export membrane protein
VVRDERAGERAIRALRERRPVCYTVVRMSGMIGDAEAAPASPLGRHAAYGVVAVALEKAVNLGIALYLPRHLGLADYGRYAFLVSYLGFFQVLPDMSLELTLVTRLARAGADARRLAGPAAIVRLGVSLVGAALGLALLAAIGRDGELVAAGAVSAATLALLAANPYRALLRAELRLRRYVGLIAGQSAISVGLLAAVVQVDGGLIAVFAAVGGGAVGGLALGRLLVGAGTGLAPDRPLAMRLLADAWPLAATALALIGAQQVVQLLLLRLHGPGEVGLLGGAQRLVEAVGFLPQALMLSVLPVMSRAALAPNGAARAASDASRVLAIAVLPAAAALALWSEAVLRGVLGPPFVAAAPVLRILAPVTLLGATGVVVTNLLVALGLQRILLAVNTIAGAALVALGAILVPEHGAAGAAAAVLAATLGGQIALVALPATRRHVGPVLGAVMRPLALAALAAAGVVAFGGSLGAGAGLLFIAYPVALLATATVTRADLARWLSAR